MGRASLIPSINVDHPSRGFPCEHAVPVTDGLTIGRAGDAALRLNDPAVSRAHARIIERDGLWIIEDSESRGGTYLNGRPIRSETLAAGDLLGVGPFSFRFDGLRLLPEHDRAGAAVHARNLCIRRGGNLLLNDVTLTIEPGEFVGILGASGAGKSTLLDALCGLRPADSGTVQIDGSSESSSVGYVPQDDIVPTELTVRAALTYAAELRLAHDVPRRQARILAEKTAAAVGLEHRMDTRISRLSGGQRKRVSVAAELLARPRVLFLDEPTSGLDPATESRLMRMLRELSTQSCTVLCTTHVVENAHLFDRIAILREGRIVFMGSPAEAPAAFDVETIGEIYEELEAQEPVETHRAAAPPRLVIRKPPGRSRPRRAYPVLVRRQLARLAADRLNLALVAAQPVAIASLVCWVSRDPPLVLFFAIVATLWFGCGNAAQEIVREMPMVRRERLVGISRGAYLSSKFTVFSALTILQTLSLYGVMNLLCGGLPGLISLQAAGLTATALASCAIGLAISAAVATPLQAAMIVPLILIPQILFSGFMPPAGDFAPLPHAIARIMPSAAAQSTVDVSLFWNQKIRGALRVDFPSAFSNLNRWQKLENGAIYRNARPAATGLGVLAAWTAAALVLCGELLRRRERG